MSNPTAAYKVYIRDFLDTTDFGKGAVVEVIENANYIAWTEYVNDVGEMFFTVSQEDPKLNNILDYVDKMAHVELYRNDELVWAGWLGEFDETYEDVIIYSYSYLSGAYYLLTQFKKEWNSVTMASIYTDTLTRAITTLSKSRMGWMTQGTVQNPVTTTDGSTGITMTLYRANFKRILDVWKELAAYAISDTSNHVIFEITPAGVFNLWKDRETIINDVRWRMGPGGLIRSYRRLRAPVDRRTRLQAVGSSPIDTILKTEQSDSTLESSIGRLEEPIYLQFVRDQTELERVTKLRLKRAKRVDTDLMITMYQNSLIPYRATGADYKIGDTVTIRLKRGITDVNDKKVITGHQVAFYRKAENVRVLLADKF